MENDEPKEGEIDEEYDITGELTKEGTSEIDEADEKKPTSLPTPPPLPPPPPLPQNGKPNGNTVLVNPAEVLEQTLAGLPPFKPAPNEEAGIAVAATRTGGTTEADRMFVSFADDRPSIEQTPEPPFFPPTPETITETPPDVADKAPEQLGVQPEETSNDENGISEETEDDWGEEEEPPDFDDSGLRPLPQGTTPEKPAEHFMEKGRDPQGLAKDERIAEQTAMEEDLEPSSEITSDQDDPAVIQWSMEKRIAAVFAVVSVFGLGGLTGVGWQKMQNEINRKPVKKEPEHPEINQTLAGTNPNAEELATARGEARSAKTKADEMRADLDMMLKHPVLLSGIPLLPGNEGQYCPIDTTKLTEIMSDRGYRLINKTPVPNPTFLFLKTLGNDDLHFVELSLWDTEPRIRWDKFEKTVRGGGGKVTVRGHEWTEPAEAPKGEIAEPENEL
jgi:hypothetical protein